MAAGGVQGNIYDQSFNAGLGPTFCDGGGVLLGNLGSPGPWHLDGTTTPGAPWTQSARADIPISGANTGLPCDYGPLAPDNLVGPTAKLTDNPVTKLYVRFAYKQSNPFNYNGTNSNADFLKLCRTYRAGFTGGAQCGLGIDAGGNNYFLISNDGFDGVDNWTANCNTPMPSPNSQLGQWHWFEYYIDISDSANHLYCKVWMDGVLYHYHDLAFTDQAGGPSTNTNPNWTSAGGRSPSLNTIGDVQLCDTINSMASASSFWLEQVGISSQRMDVPTQAYN